MISPTFDLENSLWLSGKKLVCGVDEVGRGSFAGPVVVGAVVFPQGIEPIEGLADSKLLTSSQRIILEPVIKEKAVFWGIAEVGVGVINRIGIGKSTQLAFEKAVKGLKEFPDFILIDAFYIDALEKSIQNPVKDGDKLCASIAAASVIAKVYRDNLMKGLNDLYPCYGFAQNKGYGTKFHREAIKKHGLSPQHRTSFDLKKFL